jgi:cation:H+ antiporter
VRPLLVDLGLLLGGLVMLTVAADRFVLGAARLSTALKISPVLIGAIVIGFGTSAPEFLVTILATLRGSQDLAFGNIVGSNTANVTLVLGAAALVVPIKVSVSTLRRETPLMLLAMLVLTLATYNRRVGTFDAIMLLVAAVVALGLIVRTALSDREAAAILEAEVAEYEGADIRLPPTLLLTVLGLGGTLLGAQLLVDGATGLARTIGMSEAAIGLTIVAVGTSLPELVTAVAAARRRETDLIVGNVLGSNLFNALPVAGIAGLLDTVDLDPAFIPALVVMLGVNAVAAVFLMTGRRLARAEGGLLLVAFVIATFVML